MKVLLVTHTLYNKADSSSWEYVLRDTPDNVRALTQIHDQIGEKNISEDLIVMRANLITVKELEIRLEADRLG